MCIVINLYVEQIEEAVREKMACTNNFWNLTKRGKTDLRNEHGVLPQVTFVITKM